MMWLHTLNHRANLAGWARCCLSIIVFSVVNGFSLLQAQDPIWQDVSPPARTEKSANVAQLYRSLQMNHQAWLNWVQDVPNKSSEGKVLRLPLPDGSWESFQVWPNNLLSPSLQVSLPAVYTFRGRGVDDRSATIAIDWTSKGFHAMVISAQKGTYYLDPVAVQKQEYISYFKKNYQALGRTQHETPVCQLEQNFSEKQASITSQSENKPSTDKDGELAARGSGEQLRTYRLAVSATGEYTQFHDDGNAANGNAVVDAQQAIISTMNRVSLIYEREISVSLILVNNDSIVFENPSTDPFTSSNASLIIEENQSTIDAELGSNAYDIGHVLTRTPTGGNGLASIGAVCRADSKAKAFSGLVNPEGDPFDVDFVAHEIGHQFGATHTFNGTTQSCGLDGQRIGFSAYEPGSGSTIMAYAGICGIQNIQSNSDDYFHTHSYGQILNFIENTPCPQITNTGNQFPSVEIPEMEVTIPISTPFILKGTGDDSDGDPLTFCWEQYDRGEAGPPGDPESDGPLFRSISPRVDSFRVFPNLDNLLNNTQNIGEALPSTNRAMNFRLTVRDGQGGVNFAQTSFQVTDQAGPFLVSAPNESGITWPAASTQAVTWEVANTDLFPVNCSLVNILLSTDGGFTYPILLAENTPNDGFQYVVVPDISSNQVRIKVEAVDNIFFDVSNENLAITPASGPDFTVITETENQLLCVGEQISYLVDIGAIRGFDGEVSLSLGDLSAGINATLSNDTASPGDQIELTLTGEASVSSGIYTIPFISSASTGTKEIDITVEVINNNDLMIELLEPTNNTQATLLQPFLDWEDIEISDSYQIQIARDSVFIDLLYNVDELDSSSFRLPAPLEDSTTYFWRVRASNICGSGEYSPTFRFTTLDCGEPENRASIISTAVPVAIDSVLPNTVFSSVYIPKNLTISDINVINLRGEHTYVGDLTFTLTSPQGTEVILINRICNDNANANFDLSLDDSSPFPNILCPPIDQRAYPPLEPLNRFANETSSGDWLLTIEDNADLDGGRLLNWSLEICGLLISDNTAPQLSLNTGLQSFPNASPFLIDENLLQATDAEDDDQTIRYIIKTLPNLGQVTLDGLLLDEGDSFTQGELSAKRVRYQANVEGDFYTDSFVFALEDSEGFQSPRDTFNISIDIVNDIEDERLAQGIRVFPNPSQAVFQIAMDFTDLGAVHLELYEMSGKKVKDLHFVKQNKEIVFPWDLTEVAPGMYLMVIRTAQGSTTKRILKTN